MFIQVHRYISDRPGSLEGCDDVDPYQVMISINHIVYVTHYNDPYPSDDRERTENFKACLIRTTEVIFLVPHTVDEVMKKINKLL